MTQRSKQHTLWLLAAIAVPTAHFSGCGWLASLVTALVILPLSLIPKDWEGLPKPLTLLQILWLGAAAGILLQNSAAYWPSSNDSVVPLVLLALAAATPCSSAPRIGAVLCFCMALLALPAAISGAVHIEPRWLKPDLKVWPTGLALALLLPNLPAAESRKKGKSVLAAGVLSVALALLIQGVMTTAVASTLRDPFYQTARTLGHLEPMVASGVALGWYAMTSLFLTSAQLIAKKQGMGRILTNVLLLGTSTGAVIFQWQPDGVFVLVLSLFLWVLEPFLRKMNGSEKSEK